MDPKISVILPVFNASSYLRQCMDSVLGQTLKEIELICVDDGSTDDSLSLLKEYAAHDSRVKIIEQQNAGAGAARNNGLAIAKGKFLSFLDADDFFEEDMLEKAYRKAVDSSAQILVFRSNQYREDIGKLVATPWTLKTNALPPYRPMNRYTFTDNVFKVFVGWAWDKLFERKFVEDSQLQFQEIRTSNDMLFVFTAIVIAEKIEIIDEVLAHHRGDNPRSLSKTREKSWDCFHTALLALRSALEQRGIFWELEQDYINYALHFSLWHLDTLSGPKQEVLFNTLKDEWFAEFGIDSLDQDSFYNKGEYRKYLRIKEHPYEEYFSD